MFCNLKIKILLVFFLPFLLLEVWGNSAIAEDFQAQFMSLRSSEVNVRTGPGYRYPIEFVYKRRSLPVKVIDKFDHWRKIQDFEGDAGWVHRNLLNDKNAVIAHKSSVLIKRNPTYDSPSVAEMEKGVVAVVQECEYDWCLIEIEGYEGWVNKKDVWGVE